MKQNLKTIIGTLSLSAVALTAPAQVAGDTPSFGSARPEQSQEPQQNRNHQKETDSAAIGAVKAGEFIGMEVVNLQNEELGSVSEIAVDLESGRIVGVILSTGGFLGIGASETVVPPVAFVLEGTDEDQQLQLDVNKERLLGAPRFDTSEWSEAFTSERLLSVYKHFGMEASFDFIDEADQKQQPFTLPESRLKGIQPGSEIIGMEVATLKDEEVGNVSEIILDLPAGRVIAMIVESGDFLDIEDGLSAIPASSFRLSADRDTLQIETDKSALNAAPHFKEDSWPDFTQEETVAAIFSAHSAQPYVRSDTTQKYRVSMSGNQKAKTPATQGGNSADMATTSAIRKEIQELETLSLNARNVIVVTNEGHTTLTGPVDTADEKQTIGEIANRNNQESEVENLLVVTVTSAKPE